MYQTQTLWWRGCYFCCWMPEKCCGIVRFRISDILQKRDFFVKKQSKSRPHGGDYRSIVPTDADKLLSTCACMVAAADARQIL